MTQQAKKPIPGLLTLYAVTFLHPGTGQTTGVVDLPVQREVHTRHPMYASSGLKGALRDKAETRFNDQDNIAIVFGGDDETNPSAGSLSLTDARILAFPVRSLQKVFVWVTCPMVIRRMLRDMQLIGYSNDKSPNFDQAEPKDENAWVGDNTWQAQAPLVLEEIALKVTEEHKVVVTACADLIECGLGLESGFCKDRLVVISDADFKHFVETSTQISARIKLNKNKTTTGDGGNLWYEESLPPETILYSLALFHQPRPPAKTIDSPAQHTDPSSKTVDSPDAVSKKIEEWIADGFLQIGGNETVGQGWCRIKLTRQIQGESKS